VSGASQSFDSANAGSRVLSVNGGYSIIDGNGGANYTVLRQSASGTITPATLTLTYVANPVSSVYGDALPTLTGTVLASGLFGQDSIATVTSGAATFTSSANSTSSVGIYGISGGGLLAASGNYATTFVQASGNATALSVTARPITITADAQSRGVGSSNPALTYTVAGDGANRAGLVNGDSLSGALSTLANTQSLPGAYAITQGTLSAGQNYTLTYVGNQLTVVPSVTPLTVAVATIAPNIAQQIVSIPSVAKQQEVAAVSNSSQPQVLISTNVNSASVTTPKPVDENVSASGDSSQWHGQNGGAGQ